MVGVVVKNVCFNMIERPILRYSRPRKQEYINKQDIC